MQVRLQDQLRQFWLSTLDDSPKNSSVQNFQANSGISKFFNNSKDKDLSSLCKFRTTNHKLPTECGCWCNI